MRKAAELFLNIIAVGFLLLFSRHDSRLCGDRPDRDAGIGEAMRGLDFFASQRAYPESVIPERGFYSAYSFSNTRMQKAARILKTEDVWTSIGPTNQGGRTNALAVDPGDPDVIYAGAASGGLWRLTVDGSAYAWEFIDTGFPVLGVNAIAVDPTDSDRLYIGTGEVYGYQNSIGGLYVRTTRGSYGIGLLKSTDRGYSWTKSIDWTQNQRRGILSIELNPQDPRTLFAGTSEGTYKSADAGVTWTKVHDVLMAVDVAVNPRDTSIVFVSCGNLSSPNTGIYRSTDGGAPGTFERLVNGLPPGWGGKALLSVYKNSPNIVFASIGNSDRSNGGTWLCKSTNDGDTWTILNTTDYSTYQGWFSHYVRVNPMDCSKLFCAGVNFYVSTDGGARLNLRGGMHVDHHAYADHPTDPSTVYFANDGGVYRTTNGGNSFQSLNEGYVTTQFYNGFSSSSIDPGLALGGLQDNSTVMYRGSNRWITGLIGGDGSFTGIDARNDSVMYASYQNLTMFRSTNRGSYWTYVSGALLGNNVCFIAPFVLSPSHPWILYAAKDRVYRSENRGSSWIMTNDGTALNGNAVLALAVSHTDPYIVYAATVPSAGKRAEVFASENGGTSWENVTGDLPDRYYIDMQVSPYDPAVVYITLSGFGSSHLYRTENGGDSWDDVGQGLPDVPTSAVAVDPACPEHIYIGNDLGVYASTDNGENWITFCENLPTAVLVMDLSISPVNSRLRAVTHGNGVYERDLISVSQIRNEKRDPVQAFDLHQNYPNPFNSSTQIRFEMFVPSYLNLTVYNMRGQKVRSLIADGYPAGSHRIVWDGRDSSGKPVSSGIYVCRLKAKNHIKSIKMNLQR